MAKIHFPWSERETLRYAAILLVSLGIVILITFISITAWHFHLVKHNETMTMTDSGAFGDFIAGFVGTIFSLVGIILLFLTLRDQRDSFYSERVESRFFELIKFHRDNVNELEFTYHDERGKEQTAKHRKVFKTAFSQFKELWGEINHYFANANLQDVYVNSYLESLSKNPTIATRKIDLMLYAQVDITYLIVFFGLSKDDSRTIEDLCKNRYNELFIQKIVEFASVKPKRESDFWGHWDLIRHTNKKNSIIEEILKKRRDANYITSMNYLKTSSISIPLKMTIEFPDNYEKYYGGHQFRLGHYFRHFFQAINYINDEDLEYSKKRDYIRIFRAQLSNYEQIVFFINSLSVMGRIWEMENKFDPRKPIEINKQLITKYNLIKNIPKDVVFEKIKASSFYPAVIYETAHSEHDEATHPIRKELLKQFH